MVSDEQPEVIASRLAGARVLVVDDDEDVRAAVALLLASKGAAVLEAGSGSKALEIGVSVDLDVILMDIRLPDFDGLEVVRRLRGAGVRAPIVALTADLVSHRSRDYAEAGCTIHLPKPVEIGRLVAAIGSLL